MPSPVSSETVSAASAFAQLQMSREPHNSTMPSPGTPLVDFAGTEEVVETFRAGGQEVVAFCGDNTERWTLYYNFLVPLILFCNLHGGLCQALTFKS